jgi:hypothetical protein
MVIGRSLKAWVITPGMCLSAAAVFGDWGSRDAVVVTGTEEHAEAIAHPRIRDAILSANAAV